MPNSRRACCSTATGWYSAAYVRGSLGYRPGASWSRSTAAARRGELRGGRFVALASREQFALPEAVGLLREVRRRAASLELVSLSAADPLNLVGIVTPGATVPRGSGRVLYLDGVPIGSQEFNDMCATLSSVLSDLLGRAFRGIPVDDVELATTWLQRNDAGGFVLIGDPAVRLRVADLV